jgi:hypothetical protein
MPECFHNRSKTTALTVILDSIHRHFYSVALSLVSDETLMGSELIVSAS